MSNHKWTEENVQQMVYELRKFSETISGGPHDRAAVMLEEMYGHVQFLRESWAQCKMLYDLKARENDRFRRKLHMKGLPLISNTADADTDRLIELHNEARSKASWMWQLNPLVKNAKLMQFAQEWANTMAERGRMRHSSMRDIMKLGFSRVAENIAWGQETPESVMRAWLWSPGHRRNIMSTATTDIGCGARKDNNGRLYWCVCFGRPRASE